MTNSPPQTGSSVAGNSPGPGTLPSATSPPVTPSNSPPATSTNSGWGQVKIADASQGNVRNDRAALGDTAFVKRDKRSSLDAKDLEKLVKNMLTPFSEFQTEVY